MNVIYMATYIECGHGAGGVPGDELDLHFNPPEEILPFRAECRGPPVVETQSDSLLAAAVRENLGVPPQQIEVVRHAGGDLEGS